MINVVAQLEALGSGRSVDAEDVEGVWELVYTDVEPFRSSPFFQTVGKVMGGTTLSAEDFFRLHRLATRGSEIGKVRRRREGVEGGKNDGRRFFIHIDRRYTYPTLTISPSLPSSPP
jgi:hypothetical protein